MKIEYALNPKVSGPDGSISLMVKFEEFSEELPFTATFDDVETHGVELYQRALAGEYGPIEPYIPPVLPVYIPTSLTMKQARLALLDAGYLDAVEAGVSAMPRASQIAWEFAATVERTDPLTATLAAALGLDETALDALFIAGSVL